MFRALSRFRVLVGLAGFAVLLIPLMPGQPGYPYFFVRLDYVLFASLILATLAAVADIKEYYAVSVASTILLEVVGLGVVWFARLYLVVYTYAYDSYRFYVGGFTWGSELAVFGYALTFLGSSLVVVCLSLHALFKGPVVFAHAVTLGESLNRLRAIAKSLSDHPVTLGFVTGFCVRLLPEVIWGSRLVGYDTVSYAAHLRDFTASPSFFGSYYWMGYLRNVPPLLDWLLYFPALAVDPVIIFKVYPPVAYGVLTALVAAFSVRVLGLGGRVALVTSLTASLSLICLRLSWDLQKQVLSQILVLASLVLVDGSGSDSRGLLKATPLLVMAGLASEFGAAVAIVVSAYVLVFRVRGLSGLRGVAVSVAYLVTATVSYVLISWYLRVSVSENPVLGYAPPVVGEGFRFREWVYPYLLICLGPLIPFFLLGVESFRGVGRVSVATASTLIALSLAPLLIPWTDISGSEWDRLLMFASPLVIAVSVPQLSLLRCRAAKALLLAFIIFPGFSAVSTEGLNALNQTLVKSLWRAPAGISPATTSPEIYDQALEVAGRIPHISKPVVVDPWMERFTHLYLRNPKPGDILVVPEASPEYVACTLLNNNLSKTYAITYAGWGEVVEVKTSKEYCVGDLRPAGNETSVRMAVKEIYSKNVFRIVEVTIVKNDTNS